MKRLLGTTLLALVGITVGQPALSDYVSLNPNNSWNPKAPLVWTGHLVSLGRDGIATFDFQNGASRQSFSVHYSRIYSLAFNDEAAVGRAFPSTRADLTVPLPTHSIGILEISSSASLPFDQLDVRGGRGEAFVTVAGDLVSLNGGVATLRLVRSNGSSLLTFAPADTIRLWIRGVQ
jgi:hypothetical protein